MAPRESCRLECITWNADRKPQHHLDECAAAPAATQCGWDRYFLAWTLPWPGYLRKAAVIKIPTPPSSPSSSSGSATSADFDKILDEVAAMLAQGDSLVADVGGGWDTNLDDPDDARVLFDQPTKSYQSIRPIRSPSPIWLARERSSRGSTKSPVSHASDCRGEAGLVRSN